MWDLLFFIGSIVGYFHFENMNGLGIGISIINLFAILIFRDYMSLLFAFLFFLLQVGLVVLEKFTLASITFIALASIFPFSCIRKNVNNKTVKKETQNKADKSLSKLSTSTTNTPTMTPTEKAHNNNEDDDEDIIQKAKDSARKRELERRALAKQKALQMKYTPLSPSANDTDN